MRHIYRFIRKHAKLSLLGFSFTLFIAIVLMAYHLFYPYNSGTSKQIKIYYQPQNTIMKETRTAVLKGKEADTIDSFLTQLNFADDSESLPNIDSPTYKIDEESGNSPNLDFNYYIYDQKDHYVVMDAFTGCRVFVRGRNYDFLKSFLSDENLKEFQEGPTYP